MKSSSRFATTRWSCVVRAGRASEVDRQLAIETLCERYWWPLYAFARRHESNVENAQDLVQAFFVEVLEKNFFAQANAERGRFRSFLIGAFKHFIAKQWERRHAQKRGGSKPIVSLDFAQADSQPSIEPAIHLTAEQQFERCWAITLLNHVWSKLEGEMDEAQNGRQFELLKTAVLGDDAKLPYSQIALELGISESAARMAASRLRKRYRQLLRAEIADTLLEDESVDDEINYLLSVLSSG